MIVDQVDLEDVVKKKSEIVQNTEFLKKYLGNTTIRHCEGELLSEDYRLLHVCFLSFLHFFLLSFFNIIMKKTQNLKFL
jgi:hypothetical protein